MIKEYYYKQKVWLVNCFKYKRALNITDDFDYEGSLCYMRTHFSHILTAMQKGYYLQEADKTRKVKEKDIHRLIDLIDSRMVDDYAGRCGYDDDFETIMNEDDEGEYLTFTSTLTDDQKENNSKALEDGIKLEEKEWKELIRLLGKMRGWWI
tara:strand:+ start:7494 stop:7949 length:456 start_codon:yes stop_codon:yes gene_type:complete